MLARIPHASDLEFPRTKCSQIRKLQMDLQYLFFADTKNFLPYRGELSLNWMIYKEIF